MDTTITVGSLVKAYDIPAYSQYDGTVVTITATYEGSDASDGRPYYRAEFPSQQKPDDTLSLAFYRAEPVQDGETLTVSRGERRLGREEIVVPEDCPPFYADLIERLSNDIAEVKLRAESRMGRINDLERSVAQGHDAVNMLGADILREAEYRGWCSEFDEFIDRYNEKCPAGYEIESRVKLVEKRVRIEGTVYRDITVWVAEDEDATDPDNWYESNDKDDKASDDFIIDQLDAEFSENGWDDTEVKLR